jgi:putative endonuclease
MGWFVYIVLCADGTFYTGATNNLDARVKKHNSGSGAKYTRSRLPVRLVYSETASDKSAALKREYAIKRMTRAQKAALISE